MQNTKHFKMVVREQNRKQLITCWRAFVQLWLNQNQSPTQNQFPPPFPKRRQDKPFIHSCIFTRRLIMSSLFRQMQYKHWPKSDHIGKAQLNWQNEQDWKKKNKIAGYFRHSVFLLFSLLSTASHLTYLSSTAHTSRSSTLLTELKARDLDSVPDSALTCHSTFAKITSGLYALFTRTGGQWKCCSG